MSIVSDCGPVFIFTPIDHRVPAFPSMSSLGARTALARDDVLEPVAVHVLEDLRVDLRERDVAIHPPCRRAGGR
jgi:hypothetical protein